MFLRDKLSSLFPSTSSSTILLVLEGPLSTFTVLVWVEPGTSSSTTLLFLFTEVWEYSGSSSVDCWLCLLFDDVPILLNWFIFSKSLRTLWMLLLLSKVLVDKSNPCVCSLYTWNLSSNYSEPFEKFFWDKWLSSLSNTKQHLKQILGLCKP